MDSNERGDPGPCRNRGAIPTPESGRHRASGYLQEFAMLKHATMEGRGLPKPNEHFDDSAFKDLDERLTIQTPMG